MKRSKEIERTPLSPQTFASASTSRSFIRTALTNPFLCSVIAGLGVFGGISSLFAGLVCVVVHAFIARDTMFDRVGTALLIGAIPAILVGSIFLDQIRTER